MALLRALPQEFREMVEVLVGCIAGTVACQPRICPSRNVRLAGFEG